MADEGFHEIQLNGKQLVFLFMSATVALVVVFLCGVMVGRGVRPAAATELAAAGDESSIDPTATADAPVRSVAPEGTPISAQETLTYADRLESTSPATETLREQDPAELPQPLSEPTSAPPPPLAAASTAAREPAAPAPAADAALAEPAGSGYVVQVTATRTRGEADAVAKRLSSKGYPTFVMPVGGAGASLFRVRVGKYNDRREAESISRRLEKEEQFKPWITR